MSDLNYLNLINSYSDIRNIIDTNNESIKNINEDINKTTFKSIEKMNKKINYLMDKLISNNKELKLLNILVNKLVYENNKFIDYKSEESEESEDEMNEIDKSLEFLIKKLK